MFLYFLKCRKNTESKIPKFVKPKIRTLMVLSNCAVYGSKRNEIN